MKDALYISWVGMGLVFIGLMALWGMMAALVALTSPRRIAKPALAATLSSPDADHDLECRRMAAAAAVTAAMALMNTTFTTSPHNEKDLISPWQSAYRSRQVAINQNSLRRKD